MALEICEHPNWVLNPNRNQEAFYYPVKCEVQIFKKHNIETVHKPLTTLKHMKSECC